jgi:hypothetical protein
MGVEAVIGGELLAEAIGAGEVLAGAATAGEAIASGTSVAELVAAGALEDIGGGMLLDAATGEILDAAGTSVLDAAAEGISEEAITDTVADEVGNITQTFDDGSTLTTDAQGNVISSTEAPADPLNLKDALGNPIVQKVGSQVANKALNALLAPATKALGTAKFKPVSSVPGALGSGGADGTTDSSTGGLNMISADLIKGNPNFTLEGGFTQTSPTDLYSTPTNTALVAPQTQMPQGFAMGGYAQGGLSQEHNPSFFSEGGMENRYVQGDGDGTSDDVAAMLANGEFVIPADIVAALGNGSNDAGAHVLDQFLSVVRQDNHSNEPDQLPPKSKSPLDYLAQARKRA